ncbi:MAG: hypothetical protein WBO44_13045 [Saprospiraceae bacterium]
MADQFPYQAYSDIDQRIVSVKKQKSFVERLNHRLEMRLEKEPQNGKKKQYIKELIKSCDTKLIEIDGILTSCESLKKYHSQFKCS